MLCRDFLERVPKRIFNAHTSFVVSDADRSFDNVRLILLHLAFLKMADTEPRNYLSVAEAQVARRSFAIGGR